MLAILTTHPIQYQVPIWQALARDGSVPFEVWYLTRFGTVPSADRQFGKTFAWDIDLMSGYPSAFLDAADEAVPDRFWACRLRERLGDRLARSGARALWIQGWQTAAYWQAAHAAKAAGAELWLRGESNDLTPVSWWKEPAKRAALGWLFGRVDRFLCIGTANRRLYQRWGVPEERFHPAPYAVDNARFAAQAQALRGHRLAVRREWGIADDAFCVLFCGKFIAKKRPMDLVRAAQALQADGRGRDLHLLFAGSGELGPALRAVTQIVFDADSTGAAPASTCAAPLPRASFAGFLNQTEVSRAYVAADCLVLPSDHRETWGLVVNEAMASGTLALASTSCGCTEDMIPNDGVRRTFATGNIGELAEAIHLARANPPSPAALQQAVARHDFATTLSTIEWVYRLSAPADSVRAPYAAPARARRSAQRTFGE